MFRKSKNMKKNQDKTSLATTPQKQVQVGESKDKIAESKIIKKGKVSFKERIGRGQRGTKTKNEMVLSLDFGSGVINGVFGKVEGRKIIVKNIFKGETEKGWYQDGRIDNPEVGKLNITDILKKNKIKNTNTKTICTIDSMDIIKREIVIPSVDEKDILSLVSYEIEQYLPIDINSYVIQYSVLDEFIENNAKKLQLLVVAMPKSMAEGLFHLVHGCQMTPYALDVHFNSLEKLIKMEISSGEDGKQNWEKNIALIDFGIQKTNVMLFSNGKYVFNSIIDYGGSVLHDIVKNKCNQADKLELEEIHNVLNGMFVSLQQQTIPAGFGNDEAMSISQLKGRTMQQGYPQSLQQGYPQEYQYRNGYSTSAPFDISSNDNALFHERKASVLPEGADTIVQATGIQSLGETYMKFSDIFELNRSLIESINRLTDEIEKTIRYFEMRKVQNHVEKIYIYGGNSKIKGLEQFIGNRFGIPTSSLPRLYCVETNPNKDFEYSQYLNALGAIIRL